MDYGPAAAPTSRIGRLSDGTLFEDRNLCLSVLRLPDGSLLEHPRLCLAKLWKGNARCRKTQGPALEAFRIATSRIVLYVRDTTLVDDAALFDVLLHLSEYLRCSWHATRTEMHWTSDELVSVWFRSCQEHRRQTLGPFLAIHPDVQGQLFYGCPGQARYDETGSNAEQMVMRWDDGGRQQEDVIDAHVGPMWFTPATPRSNFEGQLAQEFPEQHGIGIPQTPVARLEQEWGSNDDDEHEDSESRTTTLTFPALAGVPPVHGLPEQGASPDMYINGEDEELQSWALGLPPHHFDSYGNAAHGDLPHDERGGPQPHDEAPHQHPTDDIFDAAQALLALSQMQVFPAPSCGSLSPAPAQQYHGHPGMPEIAADANEDIYARMFNDVIDYIESTEGTIARDASVLQDAQIEVSSSPHVGVQEYQSAGEGGGQTSGMDYINFDGLRCSQTPSVDVEIEGGTWYNERAADTEMEDWSPGNRGAFLEDQFGNYPRERVLSLP